MSTATVDQWKIVRWKWQGVQRIEGKADTRFILGRKGCLRCSDDWIDYSKSSCYASWYFPMGQTTTRRHCPSCVTTRCWRANGRRFAVCMAWLLRRCAAPNNISHGYTNV